MIYFTGDINLTDNSFDVGFGVGSQILKGLNPFKHISKDCNDIWVGNFEGVCADVSDYTGYRGTIFRLPSSGIVSKDSFIDYYGVANNHVMEHGKNAYNEMNNLLKENCKGIFGSQNEKSVIIEHLTKKIAVTGFSLRNDQLNQTPEYWNYPSADEIKKEFQKIKDADYKVVYVHWGVEFIDHPYQDQQRFAHWLIDIGYDLIIGMHPHVVQGYEVYKDKYIFYSLGNFVFNMAWEPTKYGLVVKLNVENGKVDYNYVRIDDEFCPQMIEESEVPESWQMKMLCNKIPNYDNLEPYVEEAKIGLKAYRKSNYKYMIRNIGRYDFKVLGAMVLDFVKRRF